jgi:hypothetical protein
MHLKSDSFGGLSIVALRFILLTASGADIERTLSLQGTRNARTEQIMGVRHFTAVCLSTKEATRFGPREQTPTIHRGAIHLTKNKDARQ